MYYLSSRFWPTHTRPPWRGVGLLQERWRTWKPMPQLVLQGDQDVQGVHAPFLWRQTEEHQSKLLQPLMERWITTIRLQLEDFNNSLTTWIPPSSSPHEKLAHLTLLWIWYKFKLSHAICLSEIEGINKSYLTSLIIEIAWEDVFSQFPVRFCNLCCSGWNKCLDRKPIPHCWLHTGQASSATKLLQPAVMIAKWLVVGN